MNKRFLSIDEIADYLGLKKSTVYSWVHQRKVPYIKMGRLVKFDIQEINKWVKINTIHKD
ncbi:helix-turn-helix domain-containing protein [Patescibacteria group bacterium]|nr:helix-turn-helix domain-containing protein [Patescibacteria group bacterium]